MGAGGPTCGPDGPDQLTLFDTRATSGINAAKVGVKGAAATTVLHLHDVAISVLPTREGHHAIAHAAYRGARGGAEVHTQMGAHGFVHRGKAHRKARSHTRERQRRSQEGSGGGAPVKVKVGPLAAGFLKQPGAVGLPLVVEAR